MKELYTRQEVIDVIEELLQRPDTLIEAIENENTDIRAEDLLKIAES